MGVLRPFPAELRARTAVAAMSILLGVMAGCDDIVLDPQPVEPPPIDEALIDSVQVPEFWVLGSDEFRDLRLEPVLPEEVRDAVRRGELTAVMVYIEVRDSDGAQTGLVQMWDDGGAIENDVTEEYLLPNSGDLVPGDYIYQNRMNAGFAEVEGEFTFGIIVDGLYDPDLPHIGALPLPILEVEVTVSANEPPVFGSSSLPDSLHAGFEPQQWTVEVTDPNELSGDEVLEVAVELLEGGTVYREILFAREDAATWSFSTDSTFAAGLPTAQYTMSFVATDKFEQESSPFEHEVWVENLAPELLSLEAPDTVQQPAPDNPPNVYAFLLNVLDHAGQGDIESVYYTVLDPTGNYFESPDFVFRDDGEGEDEFAGDAIWTHGFQVTQSVSNFGAYTFTFYAGDRAGQTSVALEKQIVLIPSSEPQP